jgi:cytochrome c biogenesis factor
MPASQETQMSRLSALLKDPTLRIGLTVGAGILIATALASHPLLTIPLGDLGPAFALALATLIADAIEARLSRGVWRLSALAWALAAITVSIGALMAPYVLGIDPMFWAMLGCAVFCALGLRPVRRNCAEH